jgi:hypothetical protein
MSDLIYARPSDDVAAAVTPTLKTGTINALYPITRLIAGDPKLAAKTTSTGDSRWLWTFNDPQRVDAVWLPMYNSPPGTVLRWEGHTADDWSSPTVSVSVTVPAYGGDLPRGLFFDVTADPDYDEAGLEYWSLFVPNGSLITALAGIFISARKRTGINLEHGVARPRMRLVTAHERADGDLFIYDRGQNLLSIRGRLITDTAAGYDDYLLLHEDCRGPLYPFPVVIDGHHATPEGLLVRWMNGYEAQFAGVADDFVNVEWQMVPRGRAL